MIATKCRNCGAGVSAFARTCVHCGARNPARTAALGMAAALLIVVAGLGMAALVVQRGPPPPAEAEPRIATSTTPTSGSDYGWLSKAMADCDAEAAKATGTLVFLVIPLKSAAGDPEQWRKKSLNDIGNAILLTADDALAGLNSATLSIAAEQYVFSIRDEASSVIYRWSPSAGVKKFLSAEADTIERFKIQFQVRDRTGSAEWGAAFAHRKGTCHWVNAILGN